MLSTAKEEKLPNYDNSMFGGLTIKVCTMPLPPGVSAVIGWIGEPEKCVFLKSCNDGTQPNPTHEAAN